MMQLSNTNFYKIKLFKANDATIIHTNNSGIVSFFQVLVNTISSISSKQE